MGNPGPQRTDILTSGIIQTSWQKSAFRSPMYPLVTNPAMVGAGRGFDHGIPRSHACAAVFVKALRNEDALAEGPTQ